MDKDERIAELEKACQLIRTTLNTQYNGGVGWMFEFEQQAKLDKPVEPIVDKCSGGCDWVGLWSDYYSWGSECRKCGKSASGDY